MAQPFGNSSFSPLRDADSARRRGLIAPSRRTFSLSGPQAAVDVADIVGRELNGRRGDVLLQAMQLRGAGDRNDPWLLSKQPGKRNLRRRHSLSSCNLADEINESLVCLSRLRREAGNDVAEIGFVECCVLADGAREEALAQRAKGDETDP